MSTVIFLASSSTSYAPTTGIGKISQTVCKEKEFALLHDLVTSERRFGLSEMGETALFVELEYSAATLWLCARSFMHNEKVLPIQGVPLGFKIVQ